MKKYFTILVLLFISFGLSAQIEKEESPDNEIGMVEREPLVKFFTGIRLEAGLSYNTFVGTDAKLFQTSINGFGSGFLFDMFTGRPSVDVIAIGNDTYDASLGLGYSIAKYRFAENLIFGLDQNDVTTVFVDPNPDHDYVNTFFGYGKSKLVYGSVFTPLFFNLKYDNIFITIGGFSELMLSGKHKRKFIENDEKVKEKITNAALKDYNLNRTKLGVTAAISHRKTGYGITATYFTTPFFQEGLGPEINELRVGLYYRFIDFKGK